MFYRSTLFAVPVSFVIAWIGIQIGNAVISAIMLAAGILVEVRLLSVDALDVVRRVPSATALFALIGFVSGYLAIFGTSNLIRRANQRVVAVSLSIGGLLLTLGGGGFALLMNANLQALAPDAAWLAAFLIAIVIAPRYERPDVIDDADDDFDPAKYTEPET